MQIIIIFIVIIYFIYFRRIRLLVGSHVMAHLVGLRPSPIQVDLNKGLLQG